MKKNITVVVSSVILTIALYGCVKPKSLQEANKTFEKQEYKDAADLYNEVYKDAESSNDKKEAAYKMGISYMMYGQFAKAEKAFEKAIRYFKLLESWGQENETSLYYTALCYRELKNYTLSAEYTKKTIEFSTSPNMASYYTLLGTVYEEKLQYKSALAAYKKGLEYTSKGGIYYNIALLEDLKLKEPAKALTYYRLYLKSKPDEGKNKEAILYVKDRINTLSR